MIGVRCRNIRLNGRRVLGRVDSLGICLGSSRASSITTSRHGRRLYTRCVRHSSRSGLRVAGGLGSRRLKELTDIEQRTIRSLVQITQANDRHSRVCKRSRTRNLTQGIELFYGIASRTSTTTALSTLEGNYNRELSVIAKRNTIDTNHTTAEVLGLYQTATIQSIRANALTVHVGVVDIEREGIRSRSIVTAVQVADQSLCTRETAKVIGEGNQSIKLRLGNVYADRILNNILKALNGLVKEFIGLCTSDRDLATVRRSKAHPALTECFEQLRLIISTNEVTIADRVAIGIHIGLKAKAFPRLNLVTHLRGRSEAISRQHLTISSHRRTGRHILHGLVSQRTDLDSTILSDQEVCLIGPIIGQCLSRLSVGVRDDQLSDVTIKRADVAIDMLLRWQDSAGHQISRSTTLREETTVPSRRGTVGVHCLTCMGMAYPTLLVERQTQYVSGKGVSSL